MVQFVSYLRRVLCKTRLIFPQINGPNVTLSKEHQRSNSSLSAAVVLAVVVVVVVVVEVVVVYIST